MFSVKQLLLVILIVICSLYAESQNVGVGTTNPINKFQIGDAPGFSGNHFAIGNGTKGMSFNQYPSTSTWFSSTTFSLMPNTGNGYVGIGTQSPVNKLQIGTTPGLSSNDVAIGNGTQAMSLFQSPTEINWFTNTHFALMPFGSGSGYVGIGTQTPQTKLEVLTGDANYGIIHTNGTVRIGTFIGNNGGWIGTQSNHPLYFFTNNGNAQATVATNGNFGIGTITPTNKLQIGSVGSSGFGSNDIAFGNGTQASAIAQTVGTAWWYSNTNIALMPLGNGHGRVGINTINPAFPLEVDDYVQSIGSSAVSGYDYFRMGGYNGGINSWGPDVGGLCHDCLANVSIYASNNVMALEFDVNSDARIKDIAGISNSTKDLETLNAIQVTNYTMKDKVEYGYRPFKKIIAQQVEEVYPQVVNRNVNYIPNVYQVTNKIEKSANGFLLSFKAVHNLNKEAKKLQLIDKNGIRQRYDIIAIPSDKEVVINAPDLKSDTVFVYGEQVNDFRTVDYDGLTTLNISATQELSKLVKQQQEEIDAQNEKINLLAKELDEMKTKK